MTTEEPADPGHTSPRPESPSGGQIPEPITRDADRNKQVTRTAAIWGAVAFGLAVMVLLIIFFIQNQDMIAVKFLGWEGRLAQGIAFFMAAVGGGILVAIAGGARILQLRRNERRRRKTTAV